jgi:hypothetical protein
LIIFWHVLSICRVISVIHRPGYLGPLCKFYRYFSPYILDFHPDDLVDLLLVDLYSLLLEYPPSNEEEYLTLVIDKVNTGFWLESGGDIYAGLFLDLSDCAFF